MDRKRAIEAGVLAIAPGIGRKDLAAVVDQALHSAGLRKAAPPTAAWLSLVAYLRHNFTDYDAMLAEGYGPEAARHFSLAAINAVLADWGARRRVADE